MKSTVILCADDFGISNGVNMAIVDLAAKGRISAVSCMAVGPAWEEGAKALKPFQGRVAVGLHLTLTHLPTLVKELGEFHSSRFVLLLQSWCRTFNKALIERELRAQFETFIRVWGGPPDFIDGHEHVHVLPVIRDIVLRLREYYAPQAWMRNVVDFSALTDSFKYIILAVMGFRWQAMLKKHDIPHNRHLRGAYNYMGNANYAAMMKKWSSLPEPVLIYCHPGFLDNELSRFDKVLGPRRREYDFFNSDAFAQLNLDLVKQP